jgi:hypothetical protein
VQRILRDKNGNAYYFSVHWGIAIFFRRLAFPQLGPMHLLHSRNRCSNSSSAFSGAPHPDFHEWFISPHYSAACTYWSWSTVQLWQTANDLSMHFYRFGSPPLSSHIPSYYFSHTCPIYFIDNATKEVSDMKLVIRKFSLFLAVSTAILLVSKLYFGSPRAPQEDE